MSKSGMTRRIDELGRLVIPKEIRKNLKIKDNDQIEINIVDDKILLSKYDVLQKDEIIHLMLSCIKKVLKRNILFTTREKIIDYVLIDKQEINNLILDNSITNLIENRKEIVNNSHDILLFDSVINTSYIISPLIIKGDLYGSIIIYGNDAINEFDTTILKYINVFLENYLE